MPVIVPPVAYAEWLDPKNEATERLARLFEPCGRPDLRARPVSRRVNDARNQGAELIEQAGVADDSR
jgi:putative SOS response-associated peptidase YedK